MPGFPNIIPLAEKNAVGARRFAEYAEPYVRPPQTPAPLNPPPTTPDLTPFDEPGGFDPGFTVPPPDHGGFLPEPPSGGFMPSSNAPEANNAVNLAQPAPDMPDPVMGESTPLNGPVSGLSAGPDPETQAQAFGEYAAGQISRYLGPNLPNRPLSREDLAPGALPQPVRPELERISRGRPTPTDVLAAVDVPNRVGFQAAEALLSGRDAGASLLGMAEPGGRQARGADVLAAAGVPEGDARRVLGKGLDYAADYTNLIPGVTLGKRGLAGEVVAPAVGAVVGSEAGRGLGRAVGGETGEQVGEALGGFLGAGAGAARYAKIADDPRTYRMGVAADAGPPSKAGAAQLWQRARDVIGKQGQAGQEMASRLRAWRDVAERTAGEWVTALPTVHRLGKADFDNFVDVAEGKAQPANAAVGLAAQEWAKVRDEVYQRAKATGLDIGQLENYFPHTFERGRFEGKGWSDAMQSLLTSGQAKDEGEAAAILRGMRARLSGRKYGNLEEARTADIPGYRRTKEALFGYVEAAANRISQAEQFGPKDETANALLLRIADEGFDDAAAKSLYEAAVGARRSGDLEQAITGGLRRVQSVTKLGLSGLTNLGQSVNTVTVAGALNTAKALPKALSARGREDALRAGVTLDSVINDLREGSGVTDKVLGPLTAPLFGPIERFNRSLAYHAGVAYAEQVAGEAAKGRAWAERALARLGVDPAAVAKNGGQLSEDDLVTAGRNIVERTQFKVDPQDLPGWASSPWGKVFTQFRTFSYNQSAFLAREIIRPALEERNVAPLVRFLVAGALAGAAIRETKDRASGRDPEDDWTKRVLRYYSQVGGLGLAGDVVSGLEPQNSGYLSAAQHGQRVLGTLLGPTVSTVAEGANAYASARRGDLDPAKRFALRQVPVAGSVLPNRLVPYRKPTKMPADVRSAMEGAGFTFSPEPVDDEVGQVALTQQERNAFQSRFEAAIDETAGRLVRSESWKNLDPKRQEQQLRNAVTAARNRAKAETLNSLGQGEVERRRKP